MTQLLFILFVIGIILVLLGAFLKQIKWLSWFMIVVRSLLIALPFGLLFYFLSLPITA